MTRATSAVVVIIGRRTAVVTRIVVLVATVVGLTAVVTLPSSLGAARSAAAAAAALPSEIIAVPVVHDRFPPASVVVRAADAAAVGRDSTKLLKRATAYRKVKTNELGFRRRRWKSKRKNQRTARLMNEMRRREKTRKRRKRLDKKKLDRRRLHRKRLSKKRMNQRRREDKARKTGMAEGEWDGSVKMAGGELEKSVKNTMGLTKSLRSPGNEIITDDIDGRPNDFPLSFAATSPPPSPSVPGTVSKTVVAVLRSQAIDLERTVVSITRAAWAVIVVAATVAVVTLSCRRCPWSSSLEAASPPKPVLVLPQILSKVVLASALPAKNVQLVYDVV